MMKLDSTDRNILAELQKDGRKSASHIAEKIDVSVPTVTERIRKLQESGIIKRFQVVVDPKSVGLDVAAIITIMSDSSQYYKEVTAAAHDTPEVVQCFSTTGNGSHTLFINTKNSKTLEDLLRKVQSWPGVMRTETQIILSSYKTGMVVPIPDE
jgi:Lrp/AsnC family leucine-responsive transcriptional regulator